jgi:hypothetical protein
VGTLSESFRVLLQDFDERARERPDAWCRSCVDWGGSRIGESR